MLMLIFLVFRSVKDYPSKYDLMKVLKAMQLTRENTTSSDTYFENGVLTRYVL